MKYSILIGAFFCANIICGQEAISRNDTFATNSKDKSIHLSATLIPKQQYSLQDNIRKIQTAGLPEHRNVIQGEAELIPSEKYIRPEGSRQIRIDSTIVANSRIHRERPKAVIELPAQSLIRK